MQSWRSRNPELQAAELRGAVEALESLADKLDKYPHWKGGGSSKFPVTHFIQCNGVRTPCLTSADLRHIASFLR